MTRTVMLLLACAAPAAAAEKPNVVFILADDLGWADLGCYGNKFNETPNIDRLAARGVRFTDFYAAGAVCSPTRAAIMSGNYQARYGLTAHIPGHWRPFAKLAEPPCALALPRGVVTVAEALKSAGYHTGHFGKWHLGRGREFAPDKQGFDEAVVASGRHTVRGTQKRLAAHLTDKAIEFARKHSSEPFFIHLSHFAVHIPLDTTPGLLKKYQAKPKVAGYPCNPTYAGLLEEIDLGVGRLLAALDELKPSRQTVVVFTSDNGGLRRRYNPGSRDPIVTSNAPLRDEKGTLYEGGIRVPLIVRSPGMTPAGAVCREPAMSIDFYPTFAAFAGLDVAKLNRDGVDLTPVLKNPQASLGRPALFWHYPHYHHSRPAGAARAGKWKLVEFFDAPDAELYDLSADPGEVRDVAPANPDTVKELRESLRAWRARVNAQVPQANPAYRPKKAGEWWSRRGLKPIPPRP